jgi:tetratricopeptide (TPR) repeat protein
MSAPLPRANRLSVAMIVRDAEQSLLSTLESVQDLADEIIIVDTGSADRTREIARRRSTRLVELTWTNSFADARNAAIDETTGDWILWLDAGETLGADSARELRQFVDQLQHSNTAYLVMLQKAPAHKTGYVEQAARLRLIPQRDDLRYYGHVREQMRYDQSLGELKVEIAPGIIERGSQDQDAKVRRARAERNLQLVKADQAELGISPRTEIVRGEALLDLQQNSEAAQAFQQAVKIAERGSTEMLDAYYGWLTCYDQWPERRPEQLAIAAAALEVFPLDAQLLCAVGTYLQGSGRIDLAIKSFQTAAEHGQVNVETWHLAAMVEVTMTCWSHALEQAGQLDAAIDVLQQIVQAETSPDRVIRQLLNLYLLKNQRQQALDLLRQLPGTLPMREQLRNIVRGACNLLHGNIPGALPLLHKAYQDGCRDALCFRWYSMALITAKEFAAAETVLREWQQQEPQRAEIQQLLATIAIASQSQFADKQLRVDTPEAPPAVTAPVLSGMTARIGS